MPNENRTQDEAPSQKEFGQWVAFLSQKGLTTSFLDTVLDETKTRRENISNLSIALKNLPRA